MSVQTQTILASDSVGATRLTINANFTLLTNEVNKIETNLGINPDTGDIDTTSASSGTIKGKIVSANQMSLPASGATSQIVMYGTGTNAGNATFGGTVTTTNLIVSGISTFSGNIVINSGVSFTSGGSANFNGDTTVNGSLIIGTAGVEINKNTDTSATGAFPSPSSSNGGGYSTTSAAPYAMQFNENLIYADCGGTGFYLKIVDGNGATASSLPQGYVLTIVNTSATGGKIVTGVTGSPQFYTGFNTNTAGYSASGITIGNNKQYRSSIKLLWEPRIDQTQATQKGSWVVLEATNMTV